METINTQEGTSTCDTITSTLLLFVVFVLLTVYDNEMERKQIPRCYFCCQALTAEQKGLLEKL